MITLKNVVLRRGAKVILDSASVTLNPGEKVGLVGRNGAGKSSLFAMLNGTLHEDGGEFYIPAQWRMAQVAQDMPETEQSATSYVIEGDVVLQAAQAEVDAAEASGDGDRMAHAYMELYDSGAHDAPARAQALILGLGFKLSELDNPVNSFSGGWRMRLQLARALMCPSDLLLLDEPTNHLDLDALVWLEAWLKRYQGTMLVISHDREFLDAVTDVTVHIEGAKLTRYGGNYSKFEDLRAEQMALQQGAFNKQQDKIAHLQKFIARFKAKASKAKQAQSRVKALDRMEKIAPLLAEADFTFEFKEPANLPNPMLSMQHVDFGYPPPADAPAGTPPTVIVQNVSKSVLAGQRIGILGANGQGKSTVVKTIARALAPISGEMTEGKGLNIGYFAQQELDVLRPADNPLEHMIRLVKEVTAAGKIGSQPTREQDLRSFLGNFNFGGDMVKQAVGSMSGGEKARLVLCMIVWQRPNLLLLDEPTNHLDLATREALSMALNEFEGTVMLVSHDRALLRAVCDEFWMVSRGGVAPFDGDLDDYQRYLLDEAKRQREEAKKSTSTAAPAAAATKTVAASGTATPAAATFDAKKPASKKDDAQRRQQQSDTTKPLRKELEKIDARMQSLSAERDSLQASLASTTAPAEMAQSGKRLKVIATELGTLEERWLELTEQIETSLA
ncbi:MULTISPECIES: ATP-binding cassette domain-containing protein [unclassified Polaromonas]|jgi:ATP-binding cassette subfamily F protein 3|uniref:ABC-F family ATP-binding cassette domain-containing protein n=1 Tax=unclassified Polaromonas TaxID=2638319 RepID=UPI000BCD9CE3|nr:MULTISPECIES: ATP-binding cassette domain-containing protein [unclassified Polaromonas]OYY39224.1 MAG: ABC transporter [Polaromonas sp. 35-63-35]OYZ22090.1 MAG: ABC transporter [Polaromonas sp. 16-63-31]OYZ80528.1 MAG: ABC transporter [Polaromonas sp. 24-63-21]OZA51590.1 MAG: ABC transporter [Polaromonas sp. 17-63-33]OZA89939.1 MAG: ABC transporter [Polaromonas sp. 39-63-25]